jgi:hypothetical protein
VLDAPTERLLVNIVATIVNGFWIWRLVALGREIKFSSLGGK